MLVLPGTWSYRACTDACRQSRSAGRLLRPVFGDAAKGVRLLLVSFYFPPAGGGGVPRPLKFAAHLPELGIETHVLAPDDPKWIHRDDELPLPSNALVHRAPYFGPKARKPADELFGTVGLARLSRHARLFTRRVLLPDEDVSWNLTAIPAALRIVRQHQIDVVLTTSPPASVHFVGAAVQKLTGVRWVADLRDSVGAHPHRRTERLAARTKQRAEGAVGRLVARRADAIVTVSDQIAQEARVLDPKGPVRTIANGCDFEDFAGLEYHKSDRFRITHTGSFFNRRSPRPFLTALARTDLDVVARFAGDFRFSDRAWAEGLGLGERLEIYPSVSRRRALELQRDSDVLLLLIPEADGRGAGVLSGKVFEYLAAERPILAAVPPEGAAARLLTEIGSAAVVAPDDIDGLERALVALESRWRRGTLDGTVLGAETRARLSRRARVEELAELIHSLG
jgi:glycosyltransferase involved in cell wall biosynthesis